MKYELWYTVVVRDRHGKVISREQRRSKSFLKQWNQLVYVMMKQGNVTITDTDGTPRPNVYTGAKTNFRMEAAPEITDKGIRVGTGNTPVAIDDYALETPIAEGAGAGQMEHGECVVGESVVAAPSRSFLVSRWVVNNSPGIITVREAAIYMTMGYTFYCCGVRDVLIAPQAVPIGGAITVDWTIQVTV